MSDTKTLKSEQLSAREIVRRGDEVLDHMIGRAPAPRITRPASAKKGNKAVGRRQKQASGRHGKSVPAS